MARFKGFNFNGIEGLIFSLEELATMPEKLISDMLNAEGEIVANAQRTSIQRNRLIKSGTLMNSITVHQKLRRGKDGKWYITVYPANTHHMYTRKRIIKTYARSKHGRTYAVGGDLHKALNQDVGFVLEFGAPNRGIAGYRWMAQAVQQSAAEAVNAAYEVYDKWLQSNNL